MGCRKAANSGDNRDMQVRHQYLAFLFLVLLSFDVSANEAQFIWACIQDSSTPSLPNGGGIADDLVSAVKVDQPTVSGYSGLLDYWHSWIINLTFVVGCLTVTE